MIREIDLLEAIAECQGERNPNANTCIKLAAYYTLKNQLYPDRPESPEQIPGYSYQAGQTAQKITYTGDSDIARLIDGEDMEKVCSIFEELMLSIQILEPRLYAAVLRKFQD